jgi:hypothetical protein
VIVVADVNTAWRRQPFDALGEFRPVLGLQPADAVVALRQRLVPWGSRLDSGERMHRLSVVLPFGWATRTAPNSLLRLWGEILKACRLSFKEEPSALVVTSPHYAPLVQRMGSSVPVFYYCSDDYRNYGGWDASVMKEQEAVILQYARHGFFVSAALRDRALQEYRINPVRCSVSMNATNNEFLTPVAASDIEHFLKNHPKLKRPLAGVIGGINDRLDYTLLLRVADLQKLGTLVLVGPVARNRRSAELAALLRHPRVVAVGQKPHAALPVWQQALDVALIPYAASEFNRFCSPLRLFDHLAAGRPIVSTSACPQVQEFRDCVAVADNGDQFVQKVISALRNCGSSNAVKVMRACAAEQTWRSRAVALHVHITGELDKYSAGLSHV